MGMPGSRGMSAPTAQPLISSGSHAFYELRPSNTCLPDDANLSGRRAPLSS